MKVRAYWVREKSEIVIDGKKQEVTCYGGSDISVEDARLQARRKAEALERKIQGRLPRRAEDYEYEIREEVLERLDGNAVVTRNRYGARVLNAAGLMILDIDEPKFSFLDIFRKSTVAQKRGRIVAMVRELSAQPGYRELGFRIYETQKGIRVIVTGRTFDAREAAARKMMREFNTDRLYAELCARQNCFRARLTPKPSRMKLHGHRVAFPRDEQAELALRDWLREYDDASRRYAVCKYLEHVGAAQHVDGIVRFHDQETGAFSGRTLA